MDLPAFGELERAYDVRLGVYALNTGTGATVVHRPAERFAFCSTFKTLVVAAVLRADSPIHLDKRVRYGWSDIDSVSPVTREYVAEEMTIRQLCDAALRYSDGTAANLLLRELGGPDRLNAWLRGLGDTVSRLDHDEPELNRMRPGDPADTTTPQAIAADYRRIVLGDALSDDRRALLTDWMERKANGGNPIRACLPRGWRIADRTGAGDYGRTHDIAVVWPPRSAPLVLAVMSERSRRADSPREAVLTEATRHITTALV
ncbi:beta-lactamase [Streptomyces laurentii]|uniref:Beta-lactamase n=1 Tax=Streptomyces laurentii TaxID=39478 RepID=A0A160P6W0_STRLU|nr:beta-lactamase [Streptomyces laurentii]